VQQHRQIALKALEDISASVYTTASGVVKCPLPPDVEARGKGRPRRGDVNACCRRRLSRDGPAAGQARLTTRWPRQPQGRLYRRTRTAR
jgi:hypothetical protein